MNKYLYGGKVMLHSTNYSYELRYHSTLTDDKGDKYCRMANDVLPYKEKRCICCPLYAGHKEGVLCQHYDIEQYGQLSPSEEKKRTDALITLEITKEFPDFVSEKNEGELIYERALQFAARAHKGACRKGTRIPYIVHPVETSVIVRDMLAEECEMFDIREYVIMAAAALHDTVEDTECTIRDIAMEFGSVIARLVGEESEDKREYMRPEDSWKIRKEEFISNLHKATIEARYITMGDKLSNLRDLQDDYRKRGDDMWQKFNQKDKRQQEWYYRLVLEELRCFEKSFAFKQYSEICDEIFN